MRKMNRLVLLLCCLLCCLMFSGLPIDANGLSAGDAAPPPPAVAVPPTKTPESPPTPPVPPAPLAPPSAEQVEASIAQLSDEDPAVRTAAGARLHAMGAALRPFLLPALERKDLDPDARITLRLLFNTLPLWHGPSEATTGTSIDLDLASVTLVEALQAIEKQEQIRFRMADYALIQSSIHRPVRFHGNYWQALQYLAHEFVPAINAAPQPTPPAEEFVRCRYQPSDPTYYPVTPLTPEQQAMDHTRVVNLTQLRDLTGEPALILGPACLLVKELRCDREMTTGEERLHLTVNLCIEPAFVVGDSKIDLSGSQVNGKPFEPGFVPDEFRQGGPEDAPYGFHAVPPPEGVHSLVLAGHLQLNLADQRQEIVVDVTRHEVRSWENGDMRIVVVPGSRVPANDPLYHHDAPLPFPAHPPEESQVVLRYNGDIDFGSLMYRGFYTELRCEDSQGRSFKNYTPDFQGGGCSAGTGRATADARVAITFEGDCARIRLPFPGPREVLNAAFTSADLTTVGLVPEPERIVPRQPWMTDLGERPKPVEAADHPVPPAGAEPTAWVKAATAAEARANDGTLFHLDLKDATLTEALGALEEQSHCDMVEYLFKHRTVTARHSLQFQGTFWEAFDKIAALYLGTNRQADDYEAKPAAGAVQRLGDLSQGYPLMKWCPLAVSLQEFEPGVTPQVLAGPVSLRLMKLSRVRDFAVGCDCVEATVETVLEPGADGYPITLDATLKDDAGRAFPPSKAIRRDWANFMLTPCEQILEFACPAGDANHPPPSFALRTLRLQGVAQVPLIATVPRTLVLPTALGSSFETAYGPVFITHGEISAVHVLDGVQVEPREQAPAEHFLRVGLVASGTYYDSALIAQVLFHDPEFWRKGERVKVDRNGAGGGGGAEHVCWSGRNMEFPADCDKLVVREPVGRVKKEVAFDFTGLRAPAAATAAAPAAQTPRP